MSKKLLTVGFVASIALLVLLSTRLSTETSAQTPPVPTNTAVATNTPGPTSTPVPTATPTGAAVSVSAQPSNIRCTERSVVSVFVQTTGGPAPDGTTVSLGTNLGLVTPSSGGTINGSFSTFYYAPANANGLATITASALGASSSTFVTVACNTGPAQLGFPTTACGSTATVTFTWTPAGGAIFQFLDLTLFDNGFAPGTFLGAGPLDANVSTLTWAGILPGPATFWRVNAFTSAGWVTSSTGAFVPCGPAATRSVSYVCTGGGRATVNFFLAPPSPPASSMRLDISMCDNGFPPGTFIGAALAPGQQGLTWPGILANTPHWWRVNSLFSVGWLPSAPGNFMAAC